MKITLNSAEISKALRTYFESEGINVKNKDIAIEGDTSEVTVAITDSDSPPIVEAAPVKKAPKRTLQPQAVTTVVACKVEEPVKAVAEPAVKNRAFNTFDEDKASTEAETADIAAEMESKAPPSTFAAAIKNRTFGQAKN